jgi:hypothetical protein
MVWRKGCSVGCSVAMRMKSKDLRKEMRFGSLLQRLLLAYAPDQHVTAFRSKIGQGTLAGLIDNMQRIRGSTTTEIQYQQALTQFRKSPSPPGHVLDWVCRDDGDYLGHVMIGSRRAGHIGYCRSEPGPGCSIDSCAATSSAGITNCGPPMIALAWPRSTRNGPLSIEGRPLLFFWRVRGLGCWRAGGIGILSLLVGGFRSKRDKHNGQQD